MAWSTAVSPDGACLATASWDGTAQVLVVDQAQLVALAQSRVTRWWTPAACRQYLHRENCPPRPGH